MNHKMGHQPSNVTKIDQKVKQSPIKHMKNYIERTGLYVKVLSTKKSYVFYDNVRCLNTIGHEDAP